MIAKSRAIPTWKRRQLTTNRKLLRNAPQKNSSPTICTKFARPVNLSVEKLIPVQSVNPITTVPNSGRMRKSV